MIAEVGGRQIQRTDVEFAARRLAGSTGVDRVRLLDKLVRDETMAAYAETLELQHDPEFRRMQRNLLIGRLRATMLEPRLADVDLTDGEIAAAYDLERHRYRRPPAMRLAVLKLRIRNGDDNDVIAKLTQARALVSTLPVEATGFGELAISFSEYQATRYKGGDVGWVDLDRGHVQIHASALDTARVLEADGDVSDPIVADGHGYLLRRMAFREEQFTPLADVTGVIRKRLIAEKRRVIEEAFAQEIREKVPVVIYQEAYDRIPVPSKPTVASGPPSMP